MYIDLLHSHRGIFTCLSELRVHDGRPVKTDTSATKSRPSIVYPKCDYRVTELLSGTEAQNESHAHKHAFWVRKWPRGSSIRCTGGFNSTIVRRFKLVAPSFRYYSFVHATWFHLQRITTISDASLAVQ